MLHVETGHSVATIEARGTRGSSGRLIAWALGAIVVLGSALRTAQAFANTSMWLDEIALVKGVLDADPWGLLARPLPFDQVAPKGFLLAQKLSVVAFGPSDSALRLFPFLSALVAMVLFARLAQRALPAVGAIAATLVFAASAPLITFAGLVKQYSTDVMAAVVLTWLAFDLTSLPVTVTKAWRVAILGAVLVWFSQPAVIVAAAMGIPILAWFHPDRPANRWRASVLVVAVWGASALAVTLASMGSMSAATRDYMRVYWEAGFFPATVARAVELAWPWPNIRLLFTSGPGAQAGFGYPLFPLYPVLTVIGFAALWIQRRRVAVLLGGPVVLALLAAISRQYPFSDRLILFLAPSLFLAIGATCELAYTYARRVSAPVAACVVAGICAGAVMPVATSLPPYRIEDVKGVLAQIASKRQPGDATYVYYGAAPVMSVYAHSFGYGPGDYFVGGCHRAESRRYLEELDTFRDTPRVWVILTHSLPAYREREDILGYLNAVGRRLEHVSVASHVMGRAAAPAEAYLYDLRAAPKDGVDSATFKLTGTSVLNPRSGCLNGPQAMIPADFQCGLPNTRCTRQSPVQSRAAAGER